MQNEFLTPEFIADSEVTVDGVYRLGAILGRSAGGVVYETSFGDEKIPAAIKICRGDLIESAPLLDRWRGAMTLSHPNLLRIYAAGAALLHDAPVIYVVMERAEESLAGVLTRRRLSEDEVREMLAPTVEALGYLHKSGCAHGHIKASNILAVGDTVKLSSDTVSAEADGAAAKDVAALGSVIVQSIAPESLQACSPALTEIVERSTEEDPAKRWTTWQIETRLRGPERTEEPRPAGIPKWIYAGLAALLLVVGLLAVMRKKDSAPAVPATPAPRAAVSEPAVRAPASIPAPAAANPTATSRPGRRSSGWAVIVAAYGARGPAEKRLRSMAGKWPKFQWTVFQQQAEKTYYLVVVGQNLSEDDAEALRKRAIQSGLPRDAYIKKVR
ncbi:MAG TPA: protein kinase [Bryobacteraceae bacterium]|jgi:tRNA A-37 threonylcarbamoyl transferase component Bud32|nr:protein kinase [Bryobacteraceae bacterium]